MANGFFITGTGTGVGKTIISAAVIKAINSFGIRAGAMKPVESGCIREGNLLVPSDGVFLKRVSRMDDPITFVTPFCYESPLAPLQASEMEGTDAVDIEKIKEAFSNLYAKYRAMVIEGVGGLMVPLKKDYFVVELAREFGLPVIVVAGPGLGTINHTMLTVNYALKEGLDVAGVIINYSHPAEDSLAEKTNPALLKKVCPVPVMGIFPYLKDMEKDLTELTVLQNLDLGKIKKYICR